MTLIVSGSQDELNRHAFACADDHGSLSIVELRSGQIEVRKHITTGSAVRDLFWHHSGRIYSLLENRQLLVLDAATLAVEDVLDGFSSCIAVSHAGRIIGGRWKKNQIRAACFLGASDDHVVVDASGTVTLICSETQMSFAPLLPARGDVESYVFDCPSRQLFVIVQAVVHDGYGFLEADIREVSYSGALVRRSLQQMGSIRAIAANDKATICYARDGLIDLGEHRVIRPADGYPLVAMQLVPSQSLGFLGIRSDNSLAFLSVT